MGLPARGAARPTRGRVRQGRGFFDLQSAEDRPRHRQPPPRRSAKAEAEAPRPAPSKEPASPAGADHSARWIDDPVLPIAPPARAARGRRTRQRARPLSDRRATVRAHLNRHVLLRRLNGVDAAMPHTRCSRARLVRRKAAMSAASRMPRLAPSPERLGPAISAHPDAVIGHLHDSCLERYDRYGNKPAWGPT